jgi:hypothetical protein
MLVWLTLAWQCYIYRGLVRDFRGAWNNRVPLSSGTALESFVATFSVPSWRSPVAVLGAPGITRHRGQFQYPQNVFIEVLLGEMLLRLLLAFHNEAVKSSARLEA